MRNLLVFLMCFLILPEHAHSRIELVCADAVMQDSQMQIKVDCNNRQRLIARLKQSWLAIRRNSIGGTLENLCWEAYNQARDLHPAVSMNSGIAYSFLTRCNLGLQYVKE